MSWNIGTTGIPVWKIDDFLIPDTFLQTQQTTPDPLPTFPVQEQPTVYNPPPLSAHFPRTEAEWNAAFWEQTFREAGFPERNLRLLERNRRLRNRSHPNWRDRLLALINAETDPGPSPFFQGQWLEPLSPSDRYDFNLIIRNAYEDAMNRRLILPQPKLVLKDDWTYSLLFPTTDSKSDWDCPPMWRQEFLPKRPDNQQNFYTATIMEEILGDPQTDSTEEWGSIQGTMWEISHINERQDANSLCSDEMIRRAKDCLRTCVESMISFDLVYDTPRWIRPVVHLLSEGEIALEWSADKKLVTCFISETEPPVWRHTWYNSTTGVFSDDLIIPDRMSPWEASWGALSLIIHPYQESFIFFPYAYTDPIRRILASE